MVIKFICPNGHQLSAPDERAGKMGKCPKCHTAFVVPDLEDEAGFSEEFPGETGAVEPGSGAQPAQPTSPAAQAGTPGTGEMPQPQQTPAPSGMIVFLCPNGHKLNGPASLKGRPGQCPHCGARFVIPGDEDEEEQEEGLPPASAQELPASESGESVPIMDSAPPAKSGPPTDLAHGSTPGSPPSFPPARQPADEREYADDVEVVDEAELIEEIPSVDYFEQDDLEVPHPLGMLVEQLFDDSTADAWLQLFLKEGQSLRVNRFSRSLSQGMYGVFGSVSEAGSDTIEDVTVVAWDEIRRVTIHCPGGAPEAWFRSAER